MKITREAVGPEQWLALEQSRVQVLHEDEATFRLTGPGRLECVQGLVTCDVTGAGVDAHLFGALLTGKGMIETTLRITRLGDFILLHVPSRAAPRMQQVLATSLPPRLCRFEDVTGRTVRVGSYGARSLDGLPFKEVIVGGMARSRMEGAQLVVGVGSVARGVPGHELLVIAPDGAGMPSSLAGERPLMAAPRLLEVCRILAGIPSLGDEIDDRTLPQEVRLEELGAISYTKGCYLGQETVARLHFRGHANRRLVLVLLDAEPLDPPLEITLEGKPVGRLTSACWSTELDAWVGQAIVRREIEDGAEVDVGSDSGGVVRVDRWLREP